MKKLLILALLIGVMGLLTAVEVTVGDGTTYNSNFDYPAVYGGWWRNAREQYLITGSDFAAGGGGAGNITSIAFNVYAVNGCGPLPDFTIRMGHTDLTDLSTTFVTGLSQVYYNASYQPVVGWNTHVFSTPFNWNGSQNVVVEVTFNMQASYTENTSTYYTSTSPNYRALYYRSDTTNWDTVTTGTQSYNRPNMQFDMAAGGAIPPFPAVLVSPPNGSSYQPLSTTLNWGSGGGSPTGYDLYFGTTSPPPFLADLGNVTTYDPTLDYNQTYYWQVVPYNAQGSATGCPIWWFSTAPEGVVGIGDGTATAGLLPVYTYYGYTYSQVIYLQSELGTAGMINSVAYYWDGTAECIVSNEWTVYMGHTPNSAFASGTDWLPYGDLTQVYTGTVDLPAVAGWINIPVSPPFPYNGTDNLVIAVDENEPGYDYPYGYFYNTATATTRALRYYADGTNPDPVSPPTGTMVNYLANVLIQKGPPPSGPPDPPILTYPLDGATGLPIGGFDLTWQPDLSRGGYPDHYTLYMAQDEDEVFFYMIQDLITETHFNPVTQGGLTFDYDDTWYWSIEATNTDGTAAVLDPWRFDIISPPPQISVAPGSVSETLEVGETSTQTLTITNNGGLPLNFSFGFTDTTARGSQIVPFDPEAQNLVNSNPAASERAPFSGAPIEGDRAIFDLQFNYPTFLNNGEYSIVSDGSYFYTGNWGYNPGDFHVAKYGLDGTYIGEFQIPGCPALRDLAYDGTYFYGSPNSTTIYQVDFNSQTLVGSFPSPVSTRGIAYDPDSDTFWVANDWSADIRQITRTGAQVSAITAGVASFGGLAFDNLSGPTPTLWGYSQAPASLNGWYQIDLTTGAILQTYDMASAGIDLGAGSAGGCEIVTNLIPGTASLVGNCQNVSFFGLELCDVSSWVAADPRQGTVAPNGGTMDVDINFDSNDVGPGIYTGIFTINHNAPSAPVDVPVQLTVTGTWLPVFEVTPDTWDFGDVEQLNPSTKQFTIKNTGGSTPYPLIISSIGLAGDPEGNFAVSAPGLPVTLNHNQTYNFDVIFTPQTLGAKTATLNIQDNITRVVHPVPLSGTGISEPMFANIELTGSVLGGMNVNLMWFPTNVDGFGEWIHWDSGENYDSIGTGGAAVFSVAQRFESTHLAPYAGEDLTAIRFFPAVDATYTAKVWTGTDGVMEPTTEVWSQAIPSITPGGWNEVLLSTPVPVPATGSLYFGYEVNTTTGWPAGCDAGPEIAGYGNLIYWEGVWYQLTELNADLTYNWNLHGYVTPGPTVRTAPLLSIPVINNREKSRIARNVFTTNPLSVPAQNDRALIGYNVYRNSALITPTPILASTYYDAGLVDGPYEYYVQAVFHTGTVNSNTWSCVIDTGAPLPLPFTEGWDSSSFLTNQWTTDAANWMIAGVGLPAPSATFSWSPNVTDYEYYLTSWMLDGTALSNVRLSFDLALNNYSLDAENLMAVQVWDGFARAWHTIDTFTSLDYTELNTTIWGFYSYDISAYASNREFKIRFKAYGEDSFEINNWYIDNIVVDEMPTAIDTPVPVIEYSDEDECLVWWPEVTGADWYGVYLATDAYGTYTYIGYLPGAYNGFYWTTDSREFFKITAGTGAPPARGRMLTGVNR